ncbi:MAG: hypothetical protein HY900_29620 [Deltaproteobacteria bacterium]|nr:hypothetical protein [Deltaproteobacteria bacterium]
MKKLALVTSLCAAALLAIGAARAADAPAKPVKIEVQGAKRPGVLFDHSKHKEAKCETCHHKEHNPGGEPQCVKCHKVTDDPATKAPKIETAMHGKDVGKCFGCHRAENAKAKLKCNDCHKS